MGSARRSPQAIRATLRPLLSSWQRRLERRDSFAIPAGQQARWQPPPPYPLPLFDSFVTIAPQTMLRADMSNPQRIDEMWNRAREIARAIVGEPRIAITGFSMGGFAAFRLA